MSEDYPYEEVSDQEIKNVAQLEHFYRHGFRNSGVAYLRFFLMLFVCFWNYGFPEPTRYLSTISGFAIPSFYILSGYFVLPEDRTTSLRKTGRKIKRTFACFVFMFFLYLALNLLGCGVEGVMNAISLSSLTQFLVLNKWMFSIGSNIWFIQALLYVYLIIYAAEKLNLMRFYKPILIAALLFMLLSGEFAGVIHFNFYNMRYLSGNWLTRALPYILLGKYFREKEAVILRTAVWKYIVMWAAGVILTIGEIKLLVHTGYFTNEDHMLGFGIMAAAACGMALSKPLGNENLITAFAVRYDPVLSGIIYILMGPIFYIAGVAILYLFGMGSFSVIAKVGGLIAFAISLLLALMFKNIKLFKKFYS